MNLLHLMVFFFFVFFFSSLQLWKSCQLRFRYVREEDKVEVEHVAGESWKWALTSRNWSCR
ncbi:hypothetical protein SAY87_026692 [Trapa incisa]|uniref:Transmembrane protein n=1 Tax=Trapa incisa TaxID=236973 RepID=A0AAN7JMD7_9MYRT|nr:hypothetical protein SAY87_026692 [Trapa incisa]